MLSSHDAAGRVRILAVVAVCFVVGVAGMTVASKSGVFGPRRAPAPALDSLVSRANDALLHQRWDVPRGDNVRDLTDDGLARWPHEPQLVRIRSLACDDVLKGARLRREEGSVGDALRLAKLAYQLDPSDEQAQKLAAELEAQAQAPPPESVPPLASIPAPVAVSAAAASASRATLDASNAKPSVGQPVDFSARLVTASGASHPRTEAALFRVTGPGIASGTQLDAQDDGSGVLRATFTFLQPGRFEVAFSARADGVPVRAARVMQVSDVRPTAAEPRPPLPPSGASTETAPAPAASAKWL